jgi:hypothetical protein
MVDAEANFFSGRPGTKFGPTPYLHETLILIL